MKILKWRSIAGGTPATRKGKMPSPRRRAPTEKLKGFIVKNKSNRRRDDESLVPCLLFIAVQLDPLGDDIRRTIGARQEQVGLRIIHESLGLRIELQHGAKLISALR